MYEYITPTYRERSYNKLNSMHFCTIIMFPLEGIGDIRVRYALDTKYHFEPPKTHQILITLSRHLESPVLSGVALI